MVRVSYDPEAPSAKTSDGNVYCTKASCEYRRKPHPTKDFLNKGPKA